MKGLFFFLSATTKNIVHIGLKWIDLCFDEGGVLLVMEWLHLPMQISTKPGYYQAMAKLRGRSDLMETSVINPFTETASGNPCR